MFLYKLPENLGNEIYEYEKLINDYLNGRIDKQKFRSYRVLMGVYEERKDETYMVRVRLPGGNILLNQFEELVKIAEEFTNRPLHITTRQELQIHDILLADTAIIMKKLLKIGLATRGGGGNTIRNITGSYDSGFSKEEIFDITPYVIALTERMISEADSWNLPRKFKIAFSNSQNDTGLATVNDLGFIANINDKGEKGFTVYIAGGMGADSNIGIKLFDFISDKEVYDIAKTTKILFDRYGNRKNKHKARLRFVLYKYGEEEFKKKFFEIYKEVKKQNYKELRIENFEIENKGFIEIQIFLGDLYFDDARKIIQIAKKYSNKSIKFTPRQNLLLYNVPEDKIETLKEELRKENFLPKKNIFIYNAISCVGADTCRLGICFSKNLLKAIKGKIESRNVEYKNLDKLKINISGCPNNCGQHLLADLGFYGKAKKVNGHYAPFYYIVIGGKVEKNKMRFAEKLGEIPSKNVPDFVCEYLDYLNLEITKNGYYDLLFNKKDKLLRIIEKYKDIQNYDDNKDFFYDWGSKEKFSILEKIEGECSAGLFDLIDYDFNKAKESIKNKNLKQAIEYISRALLITKGVDAKTEIESVVLFKIYFVGKHIENKYEEVLNKYIEGGHEFTENEILDFYNAVRGLYQNMDNSLRFPEIEDKKLDESKAIINNKQVLTEDLRGVPCPLNFVKAKLILETINKGEILEIYLDDGEPIENVPASLKTEGHKILSQKKFENYWQVIIEKGD